jgi:hypothetical protein
MFVRAGKALQSTASKAQTVYKTRFFAFFWYIIALYPTIMTLFMSS